MFSKTTLRKSAKVLAILFVLLAAFIFMGCPMEEEDTGDLNGTWLFNSSPAYKVDTSAKTIEYSGYSGDGYTGEIVNSPNFKAGSGVLIIKFTGYVRAIYDSNWNVTGFDIDPAGTVGWHGAVYWRDLKKNSVKMADAYDEYFNHVIIEHFSNAQASFTMNNTGNYVDWSIIGSYTK